MLWCFPRRACPVPRYGAESTSPAPRFRLKAGMTRDRRHFRPLMWPSQGHSDSERSGAEPRNLRPMIARVGDRPGEADQGLAEKQEGETNRVTESPMEGLLAGMVRGCRATVLDSSAALRAHGMTERWGALRHDAVALGRLHGVVDPAVSLWLEWSTEATQDRHAWEPRNSHPSNAPVDYVASRGAAMLRGRLTFA